MWQNFFCYSEEHQGILAVFGFWNKVSKHLFSSLDQNGAMDFVSDNLTYYRQKAMPIQMHQLRPEMWMGVYTKLCKVSWHTHPSAWPSCLVLQYAQKCQRQNSKAWALACMRSSAYWFCPQLSSLESPKQISHSQAESFSIYPSNKVSWRTKPCLEQTHWKQ